MNEPSTEEGGSLTSVGKRISREFASAVRATEPKNELVRSSEVVNEQQRFELWATNIGLYHSGHSSLDYRFRDSPPLFKYALGLLRGLETEILQFIDSLKNLSSLDELSQSRPEVVMDSARSSSNAENEYSDESSEEEDFSSYQADPLARLQFANVVSTIDRLYKLSFKIRNPTMRIGLSKALSYTEKDPDTGIDLIDEYEKLDLRHVKELLDSYCAGLENKSVPLYLVERLARGNTRRRQQFGYWRKRKAKYESFSTIDLVDETPDPVPQVAANQGPTLQVTNLPIIPPSLSRPSTATLLSPSKVNLDDDTSVISTNTFIAATGDQEADKVAVPPPPDLDDDVKEFECPYCFTMCPRKATKEKSWEQHIFRDLRPYICTYENCKEPNQQYDSFSDWASHEARLHMLENWSDKSNSLIDLQTRECPLCFVHDASFSHVASHLRRLACFALPRSTVNDDGSDFHSGASDRVQFQSHSPPESIEKVSWDDVPLSDDEFDSSPSLQRKGSMESGALNRESLDKIAKQQLMDETYNSKIEKYLKSTQADYIEQQANREDANNILYGPYLNIQLENSSTPSHLEDPGGKINNPWPELTSLSVSNDIAQSALAIGNVLKIQSDDSSPSSEPTWSYWSALEKLKLHDLIRVHGTNWNAVATSLKTKTPSMVKDYYSAIMAKDKNSALIQSAKEADNRSYRPLVEILPPLSDTSVMGLRTEYKKFFNINGKGINMAKHIKMKIPGDFGQIAYVKALGKAESEAFWIAEWSRDTMENKVLIEALFGRTNAEMNMIKNAFKNKEYGDSLEGFLLDKIKTYEQYKVHDMIFLVLKTHEDDEWDYLDMERIQRDAIALRELFLREPLFTELSTTLPIRSNRYLNALVKKWEELLNNSIENLVWDQGIAGEIYKHLLLRAKDPALYDARLLNECIHSRQKTTSLLTSRLVRVHWEPSHLMEVQQKYLDQFNTSLENDLLRYFPEGHDRNLPDLYIEFCIALCKGPSR